MAWLLRVSLVLLTVALVIVVFLFTFYNLAPVTVDLLVLEVPALPLAAWIIGAFLAGALTGITFGFPSTLRQRLEIARLRKRLLEAQRLQAQNAVQESARKPD